MTQLDCRGCLLTFCLTAGCHLGRACFGGHPSRIAWDLCLCAPFSIPPPKSISLEQTSYPRALPCLCTYHCDSAELLQCLPLLLLAAKTGAAITELRAVESRLHSTSSAVIQPYLWPCQKNEGQLSQARRSLCHMLDLPPSAGHREGVWQPKAELTQSDATHIQSWDGERPPPSVPQGVLCGEASQPRGWVPAERGGILNPATPSCKSRHAGIMAALSPYIPAAEPKWGAMPVQAGAWNPSTPKLTTASLYQHAFLHWCNFRESLCRSPPSSHCSFPGMVPSSSKEPASEDNNKQQQVLPSPNGT